MSVFSVNLSDVVVAADTLTLSIDNTGAVSLTSQKIFTDTTTNETAAVGTPQPVSLTPTQVTAILNANETVLQGVLNGTIA